MEEKLEEFLAHHPFTSNLPLNSEERRNLAAVIEEDYLTTFITAVIHESEEIMAIDPLLPRGQILEIAASMLVKNLNAQAASIRLFDPDSHRMLSSATCNLDDYLRRTTIPFKDSIAGDVVRGNRSIPVPSILKTRSIAARKSSRKRDSTPCWQCPYGSRSLPMMPRTSSALSRFTTDRTTGSLKTWRSSMPNCWPDG